jgi:hypothetical protein
VYLQSWQEPMATEQQFLFFKSMHDAESSRSKVLQEHSKNNLSLVTLYSAFILFVADKLKPVSTLTKAIFIATIACMLAAFLLSLWATKISIYEAVARPRSILEGFGDTPPTNEEFFDDRIVDYIVAYERNLRVNDGKAYFLEIARYMLLVGILLQACYFVLLTAI